MPREFIVRLKHNETDDRWTYTIDGISGQNMGYRHDIGGVDNWGDKQDGPWNENTTGFLDEILNCAAEDIESVIDFNTDSFQYKNGKQIN